MKHTTETEAVTVDSVKIEWIYDESPDMSYLEQFQNSTDPEERKYGKQDQERLDALNRGEWHMQGCRAKAEVSYSIGGTSRRLETLTSGGLWGIESNSDASYLKEVEQEQLADLAEHLSAFGIETTKEELSALA